MGLDAKLVVNDRVVFDATVNPDFSQIESDEPQATVNQRFEVFFPERRPFFLENASFFQTPINLLFTRRIKDPAAGARLTGKLGPYAVGALLSDDRERGEAAEAHLGAFRVSRDVGNQSSLGLIYTHRAGPGGSNQVGGLDGRVKIRQNWTASFQAAWSSTRLPDATAGPGTAYQLVLDRAGRQLNYHLEYKDRSPGFHAALGFDPRPDLRSLERLVSFRFRPEGARLVSWGPDFLLRSKWSYRLSRALSLRVIVQYDALSASPSRTRLSSTKNLNADFLLTYFLHHGTALYVGYNSNLREESPLGGAWAAPARFIRDSQELFVKFSCLVRF
jgi:hypothetical protein